MKNRWLPKLAASAEPRVAGEISDVTFIARGTNCLYLARVNARREFYEARAAFRARECGRHYHTLLRRYFTFLVTPGLRVLELGCGLGDLLAAVKPARGVGVDFSSKMIESARQRHPELEFDVADAGEWRSQEQFDCILLSDLVNDLPDVQAAFEQAARNATPDTRLVLNFFNYLWRPILGMAAKMGAKSPTLIQNWLSLADIKNLLHLGGWEVVKTDARMLWPVRTPIIGPLMNRWLAPLLKHLCLTVFVVARPRTAK